MHLYTTLQYEIGLNSEAILGLETLGSTISFIALTCLGILPILKNYCTTPCTKGQVWVHVGL